MSNPLLSLRNVSKAYRSHWTYKKRAVLHDVSFEVQTGDIFGFLGQNGAGKTTTIKTILGLIHRDGGEIIFDGKDALSSTSRRDFGYLPELPYFYDHLTVQETLEYLGGLAIRNISSKNLHPLVSQTIELVGLSERKSARVRALSKGLQQRLGLAQAIINSPKLLLLDEPFSGLDPIGRANFREIIQQLNQSGTTILISSHVLSDVQTLCNRVAILGKGRVQKLFSLEERGALFGERLLLQVVVQNGKKLPDSFFSLSSEVKRTQTLMGEELELTFPSSDLAQQGLENALQLQRAELLKIREFRAEPRSLEEIFLQLSKGDQ